jgi:hypothetical protein
VKIIHLKANKHLLKLEILLQGKEMGYYRRDHYENIQMGSYLNA